MEEQVVRFEVSGECPDIGRFKKDEVRAIPARVAQALIPRGVCRAAEMPAAPAAVNEEVEDNGGQ